MILPVVYYISSVYMHSVYHYVISDFVRQNMLYCYYKNKNKKKLSFQANCIHWVLSLEAIIHIYVKNIYKYNVSCRVQSLKKI